MKEIAPSAAPAGGKHDKGPAGKEPEGDHDPSEDGGFSVDSGIDGDGGGSPVVNPKTDGVVERRR
jgi:hypothetical protein